MYAAPTVYVHVYFSGLLGEANNYNMRSTFARKRMANDEGESSPVKRGRPKGCSIFSRYPPVNEDVNDEASSDRNIKALKKEMEREKPRKECVLSLLRHTFSSRREDILSNCDISVTTLLAEHKALNYPYAVCGCVIYTQTELCMHVCVCLGRGGLTTGPFSSGALFCVCELILL